MNRLATKLDTRQFPLPALVGRFTLLTSLLLIAAPAPTVLGSENVAQRPFAYWADVPTEGQFVVGMVYEQSKSYTIYRQWPVDGIKVRAEGENYGIDIGKAISPCSTASRSDGPLTWRSGARPWAGAPSHQATRSNQRLG